MQIHLCVHCGTRLVQWRRKWECPVCRYNQERIDLIHRVQALTKLRSEITHEQWTTEQDRMNRGLSENKRLNANYIDGGEDHVDRWEVYSPYDHLKGAGLPKIWRHPPIPKSGS